MSVKKLPVPVLSEGSATGHSHRLLDPSVVVTVNEDNTREFALTKDTILGHEEHKHFAIPAGEWVCGNVREYDHFEEESRAVID